MGFINIPETGSGSETLATILGDTYVRTTEFESIPSGTSGTLSPASNTQIILDDFGGVVDAIISAISGGRPTYEDAFTSMGVPIDVSLDGSGNWVLSGTPSSYPVAIIYRVRQKLVDFDSTRSSIIGGVGNDSDTILASKIINTPYAGMAETNLQAAINDHEDRLQQVIDDENNTNSLLSAHQTSDDPAHSAAKISVSPSGGITVSDVQAALQELHSTATITDSANKRFITDAQQTVLGNTSGTNTGDQTISDATVSFTDITTNNSSTSQHGFLKKLSNNAAEFMNGVGNWVTALLNITETVNTTTPNATIPAVSISAINAATDVDLVLTPKGNGALLFQIPDNTTTGGNKRGTNAVDLQASRTVNTQVANGANSFAAGVRNTASNSNTAAIGIGNIASGSAGIAVGNGNTASGTSSFASGFATQATGVSSVATGQQSLTGAIQGTRAHSSGMFAAVGDSQFRDWDIKAATTDATATLLTSGGLAAGASSRVLVPNNTSFAFEGVIVGKKTGSTDSVAWEFSGLITRGTNAASTVLKGTPTITAIDNSAGWGTPTIAADTTNGTLEIKVVGLAATTARWTCTLRTTEVTYA